VQCSGPVKFWIDFGAQPDPRSGIDPSLWWQTVVTVKSGTLRCSGTTGNAAVTVTKAKVKGVVVRNYGAYIHNDGAGSVWTCRPITGVAHGGGLTLTWKAKGGKLANTQVRFTNSRFRDIPWPISGLLELPSAAGPAGSTSVTGSYAGTGTARAVLYDDWLGVIPRFPSMTCPHVDGRYKKTRTLAISL
jgi:hypothetical protein